MPTRAVRLKPITFYSQQDSRLQRLGRVFTYARTPMELPSSAPHVSNSSQQNSTRKQVLTTLPSILNHDYLTATTFPFQLVSPNPEAIPPNVRILNQADMRQKVVEILSGTANGCLQELGYYPGMPIKLQELEARNKNWQKENLKLYEDNKRLVQTLKSQAESLKLFQAPDSEKINYISSLEMENRALKVQLEQLQSKPSSEAFQTVVNDQQYATLQRDYTALAETYNLAYQEIVRLREIVRTGQNIYQPHQKQDQNSLHNPQQQKPNAPTARRNPPPQIPQIQTQIGFGMGGPVKGQHHFVSSPAAISPVNQYAFAQNQHQQQARHNETYAGQSDHSLRRQHPAPPNQSHRRTSGNVMSPGNSSMQAHQQMVGQNQSCGVRRAFNGAGKFFEARIFPSPFRTKFRDRTKQSESSTRVGSCFPNRPPYYGTKRLRSFFSPTLTASQWSNHNKDWISPASKSNFPGQFTASASKCSP
ncbi:hypothetical protein HYPSUDRAFT_246213 [Hypholoma sublateritium FD-334 SS-4]|uniref:Uncharacterized protein n=1 Tax=Hypholoma sublateritium (strain FD-334 SS-4) TaxID=945553 RepID=A0A0D2QE91_HYPSF|nr:hypothetical protein HYPSUDRAFT_246213 [Hypholoma sublateritium FD-334 SS-4]